MSVISDNIRNFRKFRGLTQREVATSLNVTVTTVANWERGSANIGVDLFVCLCKVLKATPNQVLGFDSCPELEAFVLKQEEEQKFKEEQTKRLAAYAEKISEQLIKEKEKYKKD